MPRPLILFIAFSLFSAHLYAEDAKKPSPAVKRILDKAVADVKKNRQEFDKANQKPLGEAKEELQELAKKLVDDGKADEAGVVLKQIGTLDADVMKMANAPAPVGGGVAVQKKSLFERIEGQWTHPLHPSIFTIERNGVIQEVLKTGRPHARGQLESRPDGTADCVRSDGLKWRISEATGDKLAIEAWNTDGSPHSSYVLTRITAHP